ncbi:S8 family peptidase [Kiritimatiellota bacterium B12222]|nr:S8 family peptidase [Kiritimatiellota bacterium B12222]
MADFPHQHITIRPQAKRMPFEGSGRGTFRIYARNRREHAAELRRQLATVQEAFETKKEELEPDSRFGLLLEVESIPGHPLKFTSLSHQSRSKEKDGIYLLNVRHFGEEQNQITKATILVPYGRLDLLESKLEAYSDPEKDSVKDDGTKTPRNTELLANIRRIRVAALEALWTEPTPLPPKEELRWWELWISREARSEQSPSFLDQFNRVVQEKGLSVNAQRLRLPDHEVVLIKARGVDLENSLDLLNTLTEIRAVHPCSADLMDLPGIEQEEWMAEALDLMEWPDANAPAVCILDTGVNRGHPLLENILTDTDCMTLLPQFGSQDQRGHGTAMAGLAAYDDLRQLMTETRSWQQRHRLESVKMIQTGNEHDPQNYGAVTQQAVSAAEVNHHDRRRAFCMALTQPKYESKGQPSAWSAAVDSVTAGSEEEGQPKRVMLISAGNVHNYLDYQYPDTNHKSRVENPAQAWNAVTVGAYTQRNTILEEDEESQAGRSVASAGELSPFSRTSSDWEPHWPMKPEIVMEGGNLGVHEDGHFFEKSSLEPITTAHQFMIRPFLSFNATSAATASASRLMALLQERYPDYRSETYRGLLVHSARWTPQMLGGTRPHHAGQSQQVQQIMREVGFGTPDVPRLFGSGSQGVTMVIEDEIQPYDPDSPAGGARLGQFNLHILPWPKDMFLANPDVTVTLRATLSTYIHPNPGTRCWEKNQKYRYASHLLRFDFKRSEDSERAFLRKLKKLTDDEKLEEDEGRAPADAKWALGPKLRGKAGSLVQDVWQGSPAELSEMDQIAIFPVKGWFASRKFPEDHEFHNCHQQRVSYSLILSIDAEQEIGLYTAVSNLVNVEVDA